MKRLNSSFFLKSLILISIDLLYITLILTNRIDEYIHPRIKFFIIMSTIILIIVTVFHLLDNTIEEFDKSSCIILFIPIVLILAFECISLDPTEINDRNFNSSSNETFDEEFLNLVFYDKSSDIIGKRVKLIGFITDENEELYISRYLITCCVADAKRVDILIKDILLEDLSSNEWVEISGTVNYDESNNSIYLTEVNYNIVEKPKNEYLYP